MESIHAQNYPRELVEIVVVDGLSEDGTQAYARGAGCVVVDNPRLLAEPGHLLGYRAATGDLLCIIAADNILHSPDFIERIVAPFADPNVYAAVPRVVWTHDDNWSTRYINDFTDPFNHFLYGSAANQTTFGRAYRIKRSAASYVVYDFPADKPPLIAIAQGTTVRAGMPKREGWEEDDILPIVDLLREGHDIAYVPEALIEHHTVEGLFNFVRSSAPASLPVSKTAISRSGTARRLGAATANCARTFGRSTRSPSWRPRRSRPSTPCATGARHGSTIR